MAIMNWFEKKLVNSSLFDVWRRWSMQRVLKHVKEIKGPVLEVGCGKGTTTIELAKKLPHNKIFAMDYDPEQVALGRKRIAEHPEFARRVTITLGDATNLDFTNNSFAAVFSFLTHHHIKNWKKVLHEEFRVLRPGGHLYLDDLALKPWPRLRHWFIPAEGVFTVEEFMRELEHVGFMIFEVHGRWKFWLHCQKPK